jgi:multidrug efflux pump subunit AcrA (membrane-fusion protein)
VVLYNVKINFDVSEHSPVKIGMSATADIIIDKRSNVLLVPDRAIQKDSQGNPVVKVMINGQIQERQVVTGISDGLKTEILSGLREGEVVVIETKTKPKKETEIGFL